MKIRKAVLPVAGMGTRFLPATKAVPKEMLPVVDKPLVQYALEEAYASGIEDIIFVTGRGKTAIENHFDASVHEVEALLEARDKQQALSDFRSMLPEKGRIAFTRQGVPKGLGHAVLCARPFVGDEPFALLLADDIFQGQEPALGQLMSAHEQMGGNIISVMQVPHEDVSKYGVLDPGERQGKIVEVKGLVEKPNADEAPSNLAISGRYILQPEVFNFLENIGTGAGGEIQLTDALSDMMATSKIHGVEVDSERHDCGDKFGFIRANILYALEREDLRDNVQKLINSLSSK